MARIESESARIGALVEGMLALARAQEEVARHPEPVPLRDLAAEAIDAARVRDPARTWLLVEGPALTLPGDPSGLRRVLDNLLGNVTAHTPRGTTALLRLTSAADHVVIEVSDDGPGLSARDGRDPSGRFVRHPGDHGAAPPDGAGLGLAIVRSIAEAHGGGADITPSGAGHGLTVQVRLPGREPVDPSGPASGDRGR